MSNDRELTVVDAVTPAAQMQHASDVAGACKQIVAATAQTIQGRKYVKVEGWQAIALAHHCVASSCDVSRTESGFSAIGQVRRMDTGAIIATAEGFVGDDEPTWSKRAEYARRAMAQTRAISRACRSAFAHIVILMNAGLETTPFEEMDGVHSLPTSASAGAQVPDEVKERFDQRLISAAQQKRFFALMNKGKHTASDTQAWLQKVYGISNSAQITRSHYDAICTRLEDPTPLTPPSAPAARDVAVEEDFLPDFESESEAGAEG